MSFERVLCLASCFGFLLLTGCGTDQESRSRDVETEGSSEIDSSLNPAPEQDLQDTDSSSQDGPQLPLENKEDLPPDES